MSTRISPCVNEIQAIGAVPKILETVAAMTGLGFVCIANVTDDSWTACAVLDRLSFGLKPGDQLDVATTLCEEVRDTRQAVIIDSVGDDTTYCAHHTPRLYGFQSYFSVPVFRPGGEYFGTLCGLDPQPAALSDKVTVATISLFAELISKQLETEHTLETTRTALLDERETSNLREQFIAVLGHDLRTPLGSILAGIEVLSRKYDDPAALPMLQRMRRSVTRMATLVDDVVDFTRGRMGGGIALNLRREDALDRIFEQVVEELRGLYPQRQIVAAIEPQLGLHCDPDRLAQLLSNLLNNALVHGSAQGPVRVRIGFEDRDFVLSVANEGPELPQAVIDQLFKPYFRAASGSGSKGLGLGLYIVAEIARSHGGKIAVQSSGATTTFTFSIPDAALHGA
jgi:signal transduction histidine kinase